MICPRCTKPYYFLSKKSIKTSFCERCGYSSVTVLPRYDAYHYDLYSAKKYRRTTATDPQMRRIIRSLSIAPSDRILDIGCGVGDYTAAIRNQRPCAVTGIDHSVLAAVAKYPHLHFTPVDCNNVLPYEDASFDKVISINLIEHLIDPEMFLTECRRILKPDGMIIITTANRAFLLHDYFYDKTHLHEWTKDQFGVLVEGYFHKKVLEKSSAMFNYFPYNYVLTHFLKPDLLFIGTTCRQKKLS